MKLVMRADDFGFTEIFNLGTIEAVKNGLITSLDIMLDMPATDHALELAKQYPWISVGWHGGHCWGKPVADPTLVPSLLNEEGRFKFWNNEALKNEVVYEEAYLECRAQVEKCIKILGRAPDCTSKGQDTVYERARLKVCEEYGIPYDYMTKRNRKTGELNTPSEKYKDLDIYMPIQHDSVYKALYSENAEERLNYDPVKYYLEDCDHLFEHKVNITAWHPGYLDDIIFNMFPRNHFHVARVVDISAMCSSALKQWIVEHKVELVNMRDVLLGTNEYQNHLRVKNSPLYIKKD